MNEHDEEPRYPIGTVAERTGLSTHVLRAWERRYGAVEPKRSEGGTRLYSSADIYRLRLMRRLADAGHGLGPVAALSTAELQRLAQEESLPKAEEERAGGEAAAGDAATERFTAEALDAIGRMDARGLHAILIRAVVALPFQAFAERLLVPLLHRTGELWAEGEICPAQEHVLSAQVIRVLGWLAEALPGGPGGAAVAVTPAGDRHELGALLAGAVAAEEGWRVTYLGPDLPARDVATAVSARRAAVVLVSAVLRGREPTGSEAEAGTGAGAAAHDASGLESFLAELRGALGPSVAVLVGGRGAAGRGEAIEAAGGTWVRDLGALRALLRELAPALAGR